MLIGIDGNEANIDEKVGVHQYAFELLHASYRVRNKLFPHVNFIIYLKNDPRGDMPKENEYWKYKILNGERFWILTSLLPQLFFEKGLHVFFSPSHYLPPFSPIPMVCTIHDLGYLKFSAQFKKFDFWQLKLWSAISIFISKYIIAVSETTKSDVVRRYKIASNRIVVVPHGFDKSRFNSKVSLKLVRRILEKYKINKNYILFLGMLKPSKNIEGLIDGFYLLREKNYYNTQLVIAGKKGWLYSTIFDKVERLGLKERVVFTDYVDEEDKPALIAGAKVLAAPSFWEGFGMQVLEAMGCGVPVVISEVASLPEVAGDAGVYVDPYKTDSIARGLEKILEMEAKDYQNLVKKSVKRAEQFNWDKTAEKTIEVIMNSVK